MATPMTYYINTKKSQRLKHQIFKTGIDEYYKEEHKYANGKTIPVQSFQDEIRLGLNEDEPFMVARFGATELLATSVIDCRMIWKYQDVLGQLLQWSGFFPAEIPEMQKFAKMMHGAMPYADMMAIWNLDMEEYYIRKYMKSGMKMSRLRYLEPWFAEKPWTSVLKGKKVLVIHPFSDTIEKQYEKHDKLFENPTILPEFELITQKAVQTIAGQRDKRFKTWFDALDYMYEEAMGKEFDITLIGCGAYGFPLAAKLKKAGKKVVHMGGVLQILFGIEGGRWDSDEKVRNLYNPYWTRPSIKEKPSNAGSVEKGCYW